jgi:hypothetical protein
MVDFNNEGVFTANKGQILELVILGRRDELINTFQLWREAKIGNTSREESLRVKLQSILFSLFLELDRALSRKLSKDGEYKNLKTLLLSDGALDGKELIEVFFSINNALDELNLTKIDTKVVINSLDVETENEAKGL